jgi:hypothetical protein
MARSFEQTSLADAVGRLRPGMKVLLPPGCGDPSALLAEIMRQADRLAPITLMGGLRVDDYPFAASAYAGKIRFATWHMSPRLAVAASRGDVDFVPTRYFDTVGAGRGAGARRAARTRRLSFAGRFGELRAARGAAGAAGHRPGEPAHAPYARQRVPPSLPG